MIDLASMTASADASMRFVLKEDSPLLANMAAIWATDPQLAAELENCLGGEAYAVETSRSGSPTLSLPTNKGTRLYLHSRHQPADEAKRLIDSADLDGKVVFCVQGFGLGYHVEELFKRVSDEALIIIAEPDPLVLRTAFEQRDFSRMIGTGRLIFLIQLDRGRIMLRLAGQQALVSVGFSFVPHPPSLQLHADFHRQMQDRMDEFIGYSRTSINTLVINGRRTCENIAGNLAWYAATPGINRLKGRHSGRPAIIVSAGPSLRKNQHLLKQASSQAVLIAVQTTLQPLVEMGVEPHYATTLDYHDICTRFFEKLPRELGTELIAEPKASSAIFSLYPGPISLLGNDFGDKLLRPVAVDKPHLRAGATVAHLAFYLAEYLGCDPIIFVGQDLGFSDGLCYTPGTSYEDVWRPELSRFCSVEMKQWEHIARERPILRRIEDYQGRPMYTEERLFAYLQQFERDFASSPARIIDATEGGALKRGTTAMTLADALSKFCATPLGAMPRDHGGYRWETLSTCIESLRQRHIEAERIKEVGRQTLPILREIGESLADQPRVNRLIAHVDALRARMTEFNDCYELITNLTQQTEMKRFESDRRLAASRVEGTERQRRQIARDIANVEGIIAAAEEFQGLVDRAINGLAEHNLQNLKRGAA